MSPALRFATGLLLLTSLGCTPAWKRAVLAPETEQALRTAQGAYLSGPVSGLYPVRTFEDRDFAYAAALSPDGGRVAYTHLAGDGYRLAVMDVSGEAATRADVVLNPVEFDVEAVAFTPDGASVLTAGRDGAVRMSRATDATLERLVLADQPLVSLAVHPSGEWLAVGDAAGGLFFYSLPTLTSLGSAAVHTDEVRGLAFTPDGRLVSGSWDGSLAVHRTKLTEGPVKEAAVQAVQTEGGASALWGTLNGKARLLLGVDGRLPISVLSTEAAKAAGLKAAQLTETVELPTALGVQVAKVAQAQALSLRDLSLVLDVAVCDACIPPGVQGVLGAPFLDGVSLRFEEGGTRARITLQEHVPAPVVAQVALTPGPRHALEGHVNALALDARGERVAVALSEIPARRTREIYQREKAGVVEPLAPGNVARVLTLEDAEVLFETSGHHGVVSAVALSPDGETLVSGGWDRLVRVRSRTLGEVGTWKAGWSIRQLHIGRDGRQVLAAAWTPVVASGDGRSEPAVQLFLLSYEAPRVSTRDGVAPSTSR